jgi:predicted nucleic acid-binding protein
VSLALDSSVSLAWCFEDERSPDALAFLERIIESHAWVPSLWRYEFANGLLVAQRRGRLDPARRLAMLTEIGGLDIREDDAPRAQHWPAVSVLADRHGLTVYDASYLELAQRRRLPLATLDKALRAAAIGENVALAA